jgi:hypothetical protein
MTIISNTQRACPTKDVLFFYSRLASLISNLEGSSIMKLHYVEEITLIMCEDCWSWFIEEENVCSDCQEVQP